MRAIIAGMAERDSRPGPDDGKAPARTGVLKNFLSVAKIAQLK